MFVRARVQKFQSTLSVRRATHFKDGGHYFLVLFQSTLSVRRATRLGEIALSKAIISIHALRKESNEIRKVKMLVLREFQSTLSVRRATD